MPRFHAANPSVIFVLPCCTRWNRLQLPQVATQGLASTTNALTHYAMAPTFMEHLQPIGTPGRTANWQGETLWPGIYEVYKHMSEAAGRDKTLNFTAASELFKPIYRMWKSHIAAQSVQSGAYGLERVLHVMRGNQDVWVARDLANQKH